MSRKKYSKGTEIVAKNIMRYQGIINISGWQDWLANRYNMEMVVPQARDIDNAIKDAVQKASQKYILAIKGILPHLQSDLNSHEGWEDEIQDLEMTLENPLTYTAKPRYKDQFIRRIKKANHLWRSDQSDTIDSIEYMDLIDKALNILERNEERRNGRNVSNACSAG